MGNDFKDGFEKTARFFKKTEDSPYRDTPNLAAGVKGTAGGLLASILAGIGLVGPAMSGSLPGKSIRPLMYGALGTGSYLANKKSGNAAESAGAALGTIAGYRAGEEVAEQIIKRSRNYGGRLGTLGLVGTTVAGGALGHAIAGKIKEELKR